MFPVRLRIWSKILTVMKIWIFNNYNTLPEHGSFCRSYNFGLHMEQMGHRPVVFVGSHPHNTNLQLIDGRTPYRLYQEKPFPWMLVRTLNYEGSRLKQVFSMFQFYFNGKRAAKWAVKHYGAPDAVLGSSAHPLAALLAIRLGKKYRCRSIVEIRDLWPESIVAYGIAGAQNPAILALRHLEKWLYRHADALVFTMEGAYDYILEQGWEKEIPRSKVYYINNGVDLEAFHYNREHYQIKDPDLDNPDICKIVYTGSIRRANNLGVLIDIAKQISNPRIKFLLWGAGDEAAVLQRRVEEEQIKNVVFKGWVEKKYIPFIVSRADYNYIEIVNDNIGRFGNSQNKLFDYFAAGKPMLISRQKYNPANRFSCGLFFSSEAEFLKILKTLPTFPKEKYEELCLNARAAAEEYDFKTLTKKLVAAIEGTEKE